MHRTPRRSPVLGMTLAVCLAATGATAATSDPADCRSLADTAEREAGLPHGLLTAIGQVETGRPNPATGRIEPWPWSTNMAGIGHYFATAAEAIAWTAAQQRSGQSSIDVGCFQINLKYHPAAFTSLEDAFDPASNARYAAHFLNALYSRVGSWQLAAAQYHSADPALGGPYGSRVFSLLAGVDALPMLAASFPNPAVPNPSSRVAIRMPMLAFGIQVIVPSWATIPPASPAPNSARLAGGSTNRPVKLDVAAFHLAGQHLPRVFTPS